MVPPLLNEGLFERVLVLMLLVRLLLFERLICRFVRVLLERTLGIERVFRVLLTLVFLRELRSAFIFRELLVRRCISTRDLLASERLTAFRVFTLLRAALACVLFERP